MSAITPSVVHRRGRPTADDYREAIQSLYDAMQQLEPDGHGCNVCGDNGHQAFECHHNPLVVARRNVAAESSWRCYHCGEVFTDHESAAEHFGPNEQAPAKCQQALLVELRLQDCDSDIPKSCRANWPSDPASWCVGCLCDAAAAAIEARL